MHKTFALFMTALLLLSGCLGADEDSVADAIILIGCNDATALNYDVNNSAPELVNTTALCASEEALEQGIMEFIQLMDEGPGDNITTPIGYSMQVSEVSEDNVTWTYLETILMTPTGYKFLIEDNYGEDSSVQEMIISGNQFQYLHSSDEYNMTVRMAHAHGHMELMDSLEDDMEGEGQSGGDPESEDYTPYFTINATFEDFNITEAGITFTGLLNVAGAPFGELVVYTTTDFAVTGFRLVDVNNSNNHVRFALINSGEVAVDEAIPLSALPFLLSDEGQFTCDDGEQIPADWENDGEEDCDDGSDENNSGEQFTCDNGEQIPANYENDGYEDCADGSDENNSGEQFTCDNGEQIPADWENDGEEDCDDGSDENNSGEQFTCDNGEQIPADWENDGEEDCDDGSDENNSGEQDDSDEDESETLYFEGYFPAEGNLEDYSFVLADCVMSTESFAPESCEEEIYTVVLSNIVMDENSTSQDRIMFNDADASGTLSSGDMLIINVSQLNLTEDWNTMRLHSAEANAYTDENPFFDHILGSLAEGNTDGNLALYSFDGEDATGSVTSGTGDDLIRVSMSQGGDLNWASVSVRISIDGGAPITCSNHGDSTGVCELVEYGNTGDQYWSVGDGVTIIESGQDLCTEGTCVIKVTITDTREGKTLDETTAVAE
jgi:hypothetical protein